jgi:dimethylargininase
MANWLALTRAVSTSIAQCELTHQSREPIDLSAARAQHDAYEAALASLGCEVRRLPSSATLPDSVFIEDTAVVLDEVAIVTRPGATSRRAETGVVAAALSSHRPLARVESPGTMDGGDVLVVGKSIFVGCSGRTNPEAVKQLRRIVSPVGYDLEALEVAGCLHLKSAVTALDDRVLLLNPSWLPAQAFRGFSVIPVDPSEPSAANAVRLGRRLVYPSTFPRTLERLRRESFDVTTADVTELAKAEGAVTCCSLILST